MDFPTTGECHSAETEDQPHLLVPPLSIQPFATSTLA